MHEVLQTIGDIALITAGVGIAVFAVSYGVFFRWRKTAAGKALMYFVLSLLALVVLGLLRVLFGAEHVIRDFARVISVSAIAGTAWRLVWVLWRNWGRARSAEVEAKRDGADPPTGEEGEAPKRT